MNIREEAIRYTMAVLRTATDWQEGQDALSNHERFGPWLRGDIAEAQSIVREAEERLGDDVPY
jgi:hypothetical protein